MTPKLKRFLTITAKHLILAAFSNTALWAAFPKEFELHDWRGAAHILLLSVAQIVGKEAMTSWVPWLLQWAKSDTPEEK